MPLFRYRCIECDADFELLLSRFDSPAECPKCGSSKLEKYPNRIAAISGGNSSCSLKDMCPSASGHCCSGGCCHGKH